MNDYTGDPRFKELLDMLWDLHNNKSFDYGDRADDPLDNLRAATELGILPSRGVLLRANDKWRRIRNWCKHGTLVNDSIEDDLRDVSAYCLLAMILLKEEEAEVKFIANPELGYEEVFPTEPLGWKEFYNDQSKQSSALGEFARAKEQMVRDTLSAMNLPEPPICFSDCEGFADSHCDLHCGCYKMTHDPS